MADHNVTSLEAVLAAEQLLRSFDEGADDFAQLFEVADRDTFGAVILFACAAIGSVSLYAETPHTPVRQQLRLVVTDQVARSIREGNTNG